MAESISIELTEILDDYAQAMAESNYHYYNNLKNRTLVINGEIDEYTMDTVIIPLLQMDNDGSNEPITIYLNTPGGIVYVGLNLCDVISKLKTKTTIITMAYAYSMGSLILMAGFNNPNVTRSCYKFSTALIHGGSLYLEGSSTSVKDTYAFNEAYESKIDQYILNNSKIDENIYKDKSRYEWYMDSQDMLNYGLVDEII